MRHPLTQNYKDEREQLLKLGRTISEADASVLTAACPDWSIKDIYAHLAGISSDILSGNTEGAATPEWADAHVAGRTDATLADVLDEWERDGAEVSSVMEVAGDAFPFQLFVDQWTHGWDIRAAIGEGASATPDMAVYELFLDEFFDIIRTDVGSEVPRLTVRAGSKMVELGEGEHVGELDLSLFEFARISMGRRSTAQLALLPWPSEVADTAPYVAALVRWSVNALDVIDPAV